MQGSINGAEWKHLAASGVFPNLIISDALGVFWKQDVRECLMEPLGLHDSTPSGADMDPAA